VKVLGSERAEGSGTAGNMLTDDLVLACGTGAVRLTKLQKAGGKPWLLPTSCTALICRRARGSPDASISHDHRI
jgi:methionyl-tRNA formyltransferase